jgi:hypothetical protein
MIPDANALRYQNYVYSGYYIDKKQKIIQIACTDKDLPYGTKILNISKAVYGKGDIIHLLVDPIGSNPFPKSFNYDIESDKLYPVDDIVISILKKCSFVDIKKYHNFEIYTRSNRSSNSSNAADFINEINGDREAFGKDPLKTTILDINAVSINVRASGYFSTLNLVEDLADIIVILANHPHWNLEKIERRKTRKLSYDIILSQETNIAC